MKLHLVHAPEGMVATVTACGREVGQRPVTADLEAADCKWCKTTARTHEGATWAFEGLHYRAKLRVVKGG